MNNIDEQVKKILQNAGIEKNWDLILYQLNKEYTWDRDEYCKFKVINKRKDSNTISGIIYTVEYTDGLYKGRLVDIPLEDMPPTIEKRLGED
jgi:hypothetical protein